MAKLMAVIGADTSGLVKSINDAKSVLEKYSKEAKGSSGQIKTVTEAQVASYQRVVKVLDKVASGTMTTKQQEKALTNQVKELQIQWANLSDEAKRSDFGKAISDSCKAAQAQLKQLQAQLGQVGKEIKNVGSPSKMGFDFKGMALQGAAMATGVGSIAAGATLAVNALKQGITTTMEFNKSQSVLQAVTGKSASQLSELTDQALELGAKTMYSASQIAGLQIELAKLGFDPTQIKKMTEHIQNFATAVGTDLSSAASLAGATLRMFGLEADETQRVADVLSKGCSASALSFEYLNSAMSTIAPVANAFGLTLEDTTGLLGVLANAGFDASSAATAGRNIILNLADANGKLAQAFGKPVKSGTELMDALKELRNRGIDLGEALELTDKRSVAAFNTLLDGAESGKQLITTFQDCNGAAKEMSETMSDNLQGDLAGLNSAWEGLMLSLGGGQSIFRTIIQWLTKMVSTINDNCKAIADWATDLYNNSIIIRGILQAVVLNFKNVFNAIVLIVKNAMNSIKAFFVIISKVLEGDFNGAVDAWKEALGKNVKNTIDFAKQYKKNVEDAINETINGKIQVNQKVETKTTDAATNTSSKNTTKPNSSPTTKKTKSGKGSKTTKPIYQEGSLGKIEEDISKLQGKLKLAINDKDRADVQKQIEELTKKKQAIELSLKAKPDENSLQALDDAITSKQKELKLAVSDESRRNIQKELDDLTEKKRVMEIAIKPQVDDKTIEAINDKLSEHNQKVSVKAHTNSLKPKGSEADQASSNADSIKEELIFQQSLVKTYKDQYRAIQEKVKVGGTLTANESQLVSIYDQAKAKVDELSESYKVASSNAEKLQANANFKDKMYSGIRGTVDSLGNLNGSIQSVQGTWGNLMDNWNDMSTFEQITNGFGAVISTIQEAMEAYEGIMTILELFADISAASSAKKIAADSAEMAMDSSKTATETANTQTKIANDTMENTSEMGKLGVKQAGAIASATASGASLPFPVNIAAIAAGIAAVVAAFSMVFSCFADGGIVGGTNTIGDMNLARVNKGEMILNGSQQARLFKMLNSSSVISSDGVTTSTVRIKGSDLYLALKNYNKVSPNKKF